MKFTLFGHSFNCNYVWKETDEKASREFDTCDSNYLDVEFEDVTDNKMYDGLEEFVNFINEHKDK